MKKPDLYEEVGLNGTSVPSVEMARWLLFQIIRFFLFLNGFTKKLGS
jgi:hypothetical protein